jgi:hypothetical protein
VSNANEGSWEPKHGDRPSSPPPPPPAARGLPDAPSPPNPPAKAALPVGIRDGDLLVIGVGDEGMLNAEREDLREQLRETLGIDVWILPVPHYGTVTVLRPERSA